MITESSQQSSQHPQSGLLHDKWVKTQPYIYIYGKIPLKHMNIPNTNIRTLWGMFHGLREGALQSSLEVSDIPETSQSPNMG